MSHASECQRPVLSNSKPIGLSVIDVVPQSLYEDILIPPKHYSVQYNADRISKYNGIFPFVFL